MRILIVMSGYFPGKKYGGPPVSVDNFCTLMDEHECYVVTRNHDMGEKIKYLNICEGWNERFNNKVLYLKDEEYGYKKFKDVVEEISPDLIYLQGLFQNCIIPCLKIAKDNKIPVLLAPRGELCEGAFKKKYKKIPYIILLKLFSLLNNVKFQSTSDEETKSIMKYLHIERNRIYLLSNIPSIPKKIKKHPFKETGKAKFIYLSRIVPKKNLLKALNMLKNISNEIVFDIYGSIEDEIYWNKCLEIINSYSSNIECNYKGLVSHEEVNNVFSQYDAFIFPTQSENYGHVIVEALFAGCEVIISDQTPWNDVEKYNAGWAIPLNNENLFIDAINKVINQSNETFLLCSSQAQKYVRTKLNLDKLKKNYNTVISEIKK
ncbi:glycosyltransferase [Clostridium perfringens]|uniref:glycosyltransferase n=1 Tax=Clostridium perfringens TaxID=1502 RepID=UPI0018E472B9|nr:glycosyltransferase [Clostridium perfringens]